MGGKKHKHKHAPPPPPPPNTLARVMGRLIKAPAALAFLWPVLLVTGGYFSWHRWGADHINRYYNCLSIDQVQISKPPDYIRNNIVEGVFKENDLTKVSLMDVQATAQIANAFATNPWVDRVVRVQKTSTGKVDVHVAYRQPVALVKVISRHPDVKDTGFFPVDGHGVLLPTDDFSRTDTHNYIHIIVKNTYPISGAGSDFGDSRVADAALLCFLLHPYRNTLNIEAVTTAPRTAHDERPDTLNLILRDGRQLVWGSPPGKEQDGEPGAKVKLEALLAKANAKFQATRKNGTSDSKLR